MTTTELELLRDFFGREMAEVRTDIREMRRETAREHRQLREGMRTIALRVNSLENDDIADDALEQGVERGRKQFRDTVIWRVGVIQAVGTILVAALVVIDRF